MIDHAARATVEPLEKRTMLTGTPLYWDPSSAATASGGTGTWDTSTAIWRSGSPTGSLVAWNNAGDANGPYQAIFPGGGTVTVAADVTAVSISFVSANYSLTGSNTLSLAGGIGQIDVVNGITASINTPVSSSVGVTKTNTGIVSLSNTISGTSGSNLNVATGSLVSTYGESWQNVRLGMSGTLVMQAGSSLIVSGSITVDGALDHEAGSIQTPSLTIGATGNVFDVTGTISAGSGALIINNSGMFDARGDQSLSGVTGTFNNSGIYKVENLTGGGTTTLGMSLTVSNGSINVSGGTLSVPDSISLPYSTSMTLNGNGTLTVPSLDAASSTIVQNSGTLSVTSSLSIGDHFASGAQFILAGGSLNAGSLWVGCYSTATFTQTGGSFSTGHTEIGTQGTGTLAQSGGTSSHWDMYFGIYGQSALAISGGSFSADTIAGGRLGYATMSLSGSASLSITNWLAVGDQGGNGTFTQSGTSTMHAGIFGAGGGATGVYNLSGGTFTTDWFALGGGGSGHGTFVQSAGSVSVTYAITIGSDSSTTSGLYLMSGGTLSNGWNVNIGVNGASGSFNESGGSVNFGNGSLLLGIQGSAASLYLSGGSMYVSGYTFVGYSSPATFIQSGGTFTDHSDLFIGGNDSGVNSSAVGSFSLSGNAQLITARTIIGFNANGSLVQTGGTHSTSWLIQNGLDGTIGTYNKTGGTLAAGLTTDVQKPSATGPSAVDEGSLYTLNLSAYSPLYWWGYIDGWNIGWGDGNTSNLSGNPNTATHTFYNGGVADTINAAATHAGQMYHADPLHIFVNDLQASIANVSNQSVNTGSVLTISTTFSDPGIGETHTGVINWGDGNSSFANVNDSTGTITASHTYQVHGNYTATLQVTDSAGAVATKNFNVTAAYVAPTLSVIAPTHTIHAGDSGLFAFQYRGPETSASTTWSVDWGDGNVQTVSVPPSAISDSLAEWQVTHTYSSEGTFTVQATATDAAGAHAAPSKALVVQTSATSNAPPVGSGKVTGEEVIQRFDFSSEMPSDFYGSIGTIDGNPMLVTNGEYGLVGTTEAPLELTLPTTKKDGSFSVHFQAIVQTNLESFFETRSPFGWDSYYPDQAVSFIKRKEFTAHVVIPKSPVSPDDGILWSQYDVVISGDVLARGNGGLWATGTNKVYLTMYTGPYGFIDNVVTTFAPATEISPCACLTNDPVRYVDGTVDYQADDLTFANGDPAQVRTWTNNATYLEGILEGSTIKNGNGTVDAQLPSLQVLPAEVYWGTPDVANLGLDTPTTVAATVLSTPGISIDDVGAMGLAGGPVDLGYPTAMLQRIGITLNGTSQLDFYHVADVDDFSDLDGGNRLPTYDKPIGDNVYIDYPISGVFYSQFSKDTLVYNPFPANGVMFQLRKQNGTIENFNSQGRFLKESGPQNSRTIIANWSGNQLTSLAETFNGGTGITSGSADQRVEYQYLQAGDPNAGQLADAILESANGQGGWQTVRQVYYTYYDGQTNPGDGGIGDLALASIQNASGGVIDSNYYRYYVANDSTGYVGGLKYIFGSAAYSRLASAASNNDAFGAPDSLARTYADHYYEYNESHQVKVQVINGFGGAASDSPGQGRFTYDYGDLYGDQTDPNSAVERTTETLPDGTTNTVECDSFGLALSVTTNDAVTNLTTIVLSEYNENGQLIKKTEPSGLEEIYNYYAMDDTSVGAGPGQLRKTYLQHGSDPALIPLESYTYVADPNGLQTSYWITTDTKYRNDDGTQSQVTTYDYAFNANGTVKSVITYLPVVGTDQNGPGPVNGMGDQSVVVNDSFGHVQWTRDAAGVIDYFSADPLTGTVLTQIIDISAATIAAFGLSLPTTPSQWSILGGAHQSLITTYTQDKLGRVTSEHEPKGNAIYYAYNDTKHETRIYPGWHAIGNGQYTSTGPIEVQHDDQADSYTETLSYTATLSQAAPDGSDMISNGTLQSLNRQYLNSAGQVITEKQYFSLAGLVYSPSAMGTQNNPAGSPGDGNYYVTQYAYDAYGRQYQVTTPNGSITQKIYSGKDQLVHVYVGTSLDSLTDVADYEYDPDGNLTQLTLKPGVGQPDRVTAYVFDWRDRQVGEVDGVGTSDAVIKHTNYDNLNEPTLQQTFIGNDSFDPSSLLTAVPASSLRRAEESVSYDNQGRAYQDDVLVINQATGSITGSRITQFYYDSRGNLKASESPSGLWTINSYDGAGRLSLAESGTLTVAQSLAAVADDSHLIALSANQHIYDGDGNVIATLKSLRDDSVSGTGPLGATNARVSLIAAFYDQSDRLTEIANYGTNTSSWTQGQTAPAASSTTTLVTLYGYDLAGNQNLETDPNGVKFLNVFDALGRVTSSVKNFVASASSINVQNVTTSFTYDGDGNVLTKTFNNILPDGTSSPQVTRYVYGATSDNPFSNDLLDAVYPPDPNPSHSTAGQPYSPDATSYTYDALGDVITTTLPNGAIKSSLFNSLGQVIRTTTTTTDNSGNPFILYSYDALGHANSVTDANNNITSYNYDSLGQLLKVTQPDPGDGSGQPTTTYAYDLAGNLHSVQDPDGNTTYYVYDALNRLKSVQQPATPGNSQGSITSYAYNVNGNANTVTSANGNALGNAASYTTSSVADAFGRLSQIIQPAPLGTSTALITAYTYDFDGNPLSVTNASGETTQVTYDALNRKLSQTLPNAVTNATGGGSVTHWSYDAAGNIISSGDALDNYTTYYYNAWNQVTDEIQPLSFADNTMGPITHPHTAFTYDSMGDLIGLTDPNGNQTSYSYNQLNEKITETDPAVIVDGSTAAVTPVKSYTYYPNGQVQTMTAASGKVTTYTYDNLNRLKVETWQDSANGATTNTITYGYDKNGNLTGGSDNTSQTTLGYNALNQLNTSSISFAATGASANTAAYSLIYDANGNNTSLKLNVDGTADLQNVYAYDNLNRLTSVVQQNQTGGSTVAAKAVAFTYTSIGQIQTIKRYSSTSVSGTPAASTTNTYDHNDRLKHISHALGYGSGSSSIDYSLGYDAAGRIISESNTIVGISGYNPNPPIPSDGTATIAYNNDNEVTSVTPASGSNVATEIYSYDAAGNRTGARTGIASSSTAVTPGTGNHLNSDAAYSYAYDVDGNLVTRTSNSTGATDTYTWDNRNRLTSDVTRNSSGNAIQEADYTYSPITNQRLSKTIKNGNGTTTLAENYVYDARGNLLIVLNGSGTVIERELTGLGLSQILATEIDANTSGDAVEWALTNQVGSVTDVIDSFGMVLDHIRYDSFGNVEFQSSASDSMRFGYAGMQTDAETGLNYDNARYYDPQSGRFISQDPLSFGGGDYNLYRYAGNGAPNSNDPTGLDTSSPSSSPGIGGPVVSAAGTGIAQLPSPFYPLGFNSYGEYVDSMSLMQSQLSLLDPDIQIGIQGSSIRRFSLKPGLPAFGTQSDLDMVYISQVLLANAKSKLTKDILRNLLRSGKLRFGPICPVKARELLSAYAEWISDSTSSKARRLAFLRMQTILDGETAARELGMLPAMSRLESSVNRELGGMIFTDVDAAMKYGVGSTLMFEQPSILQSIYGRAAPALKYGGYGLQLAGPVISVVVVASSKDKMSEWQNQTNSQALGALATYSAYATGSSPVGMACAGTGGAFAGSFTTMWAVAYARRAELTQTKLQINMMQNGFYIPNGAIRNMGRASQNGNYQALENLIILEYGGNNEDSNHMLRRFRSWADAQELDYPPPMPDDIRSIMGTAQSAGLK